MISRMLVAALLFSQVALAGPVTLKHEGTVKDALKAIAAQAGINLIVIGDLKEPMEVHLNEASADDAMATVAAAAKLHVEKSGSIWTVRPMTEDEKKAPAAVAVATPPPVAEKKVEPENLEEKLEKIEQAAEKAEAEAELAEEQREEARERARDLERLKADLAKEEAKLEKRLRKQLKSKRHDNDIVKTGGSLTIAEGQTVGDAVAYGGSVTVLGNVEGKAVAFGGNVHLGPKATVGDDVVSFGGDITKDEGAVVGGEELSFGGKTTDVIVNTAVKMHDETESAVHADSDRGGFFSGIGSFFARFAVLFALGFLFSLFAPQRMKSLEAEIKAAPGKSLLTGLVGSLALIPLSLLLAVTVIGIPFIPALWIMAFLGVSMGFAAFASELGMRLPAFRGKKTQALVLAVGLFALLVLGMVPVLGPTLITAVGFIAFGAIIRTRFGSVRRLGTPTPFSEIPA